VALETLVLFYNNLAQLSALQPLENLPRLHSLDLRLNPVCEGTAIGPGPMAAPRTV
jgi:hypothetical protein